MQAYFDQLDRVRYEGPQSTNPLAFRHYNPDELVLGKRMEDHLRFAACYWHTFCWNGADMFGVGAFNRPWQQPGEALELAKRKADVAFEFFHKLNVPFYCFHDVDVSPEGASLKEYKNNFAQMVDVLAAKQEQSGVKLLWGTANCFTNPRYGAGAATNPDPEVFSWAATQVVTAMNATHKLGGENYVLWGGREGYETLLNTDLRQEREQIGRFMQMVVEHGWDTDQFPISVEENALVMYEILKAGGFTTGGLNFDAKVRRQSTDKYDLFYGHIGAMDTMALSLKIAARMVEDGELDKRVAKRYAGWNGELGQQILKGQLSLGELAQYAEQHNLAPVHQSGHQELLENLVNRYLFDK